MTNSFKHENLISKRAGAREFTHFSSVVSEGAPEGFKPHPKPLALHWGMPNAGFFPVDSIDINLVEYPFQKSLAIPVTNASVESFAVDTKKKDNTVSTPKVTDNKDKIIDITQGFQYGPVLGLPQLVKFTEDFINRVHKPAYEDWGTIITNGAGDGLNKAADALLDEGDVILIEEFTFTPFLKNVSNAGGIPIPIKLNLDKSLGKQLGLDVEYLTDLLSNWTKHYPGLRFPKAIYTIPTGQNPTGLTQPLAVRKQVYALAEEYDLAIIEDDPYGYLTLQPWAKPANIFKLNEFLEVDEYIANHITPSYLTIDTSGRVIRIETFSKLFAPGLRLGFIVAHKKIIDVIERYANVVTRSSLGVSQIIVNNVIEQKFGGVDGWLQWILKMRQTYSHRRDLLLNEFYESKAYKAGNIDVIDPQAGMFVSVFVKIPEEFEIEEKINLLSFKFQNYGVGVVLGLNMAIDKEFSRAKGNFFRLTFAPANNDAEIVEAAKRFISAIEDFYAKGLNY